MSIETDPRDISLGLNHRLAMRPALLPIKTHDSCEMVLPTKRSQNKVGWNATFLIIEPTKFNPMPMKINFRSDIWLATNDAGSSSRNWKIWTAVEVQIIAFSVTSKYFETGSDIGSSWQYWSHIYHLIKSKEDGPVDNPLWISSERFKVVGD